MDHTPTHLKSSEFEFDYLTKEAKCHLCAKSQWTNFSNVKAHAKTEKHQAQVVKKARMDISENNFVPRPRVDSTKKFRDISNDIDYLDFSLPEEIEMNAVPSNIFEKVYECLKTLQSLNFSTNDDSEFLLEDISNKWCNNEFEPFENAPSSDDIETYHPPTSLPQADYSASKMSYESDWAPYPSKTMFLTDILFNSPCLQFSEVEKRAVLKWGKEIGGSDIPMLSALERTQEILNSSLGDPTSEKQTRNGNTFYINEIGATIANVCISKSLSLTILIPRNRTSNPLVRLHPTFYPMKNSSGSVSQTWHGAKWYNELPNEMLTPMAIHPNGNHFYVGELSQINDGTYFIPQRWFTKENNRLWAKGLLTIETTNGFVVDTASNKEYALEDFILNFEDL
ncbi:hypothetical protein Clacol_007903 [Clathrus columnatus]|uniref:Uncharacterized protein n=1 Tax=Clathrus columnatus TaxID=1419009 RepID=A0AAV5AIX6_9AGAM|nr:hypothetical protein Clacol_007903 [Clathrus columnatus]